LLAGATILPALVDSVEGVGLGELDDADDEELGKMAQIPASAWQPVPHAAPKPQKPSAPQHAPNDEPLHVNPLAFPHVPSREMGSAVEDGSTEEVDAIVDEDDAMDDVDPPMGSTALQLPKSDWQPSPQNVSSEPQ
jgi:hypothetical protein